MKIKNKLLIASMAAVVVFLSGASFSYAALQYQEMYTSASGMNKILVIVHENIYAALYEPSLKQYVKDLEREKYCVTLTKFIRGKPQELKNYIKLFPKLEGCVFVGDLPNAYFEISNDFNCYGYTKFPTDLFYTDLNGVWLDQNGNGIYDAHVRGIAGKSLRPEIWLGHLSTSLIKNPEMDQVALLKNYFAKNHTYRTTGFPKIEKRALLYADDDWANWVVGPAEVYSNLKKAYSKVNLINNRSLTRAKDYECRLKGNYEWIQVHVHSDSTDHYFQIPGSNGSVYETDRHGNYITVNSYQDIRTIDPTALFYNLYACSNCRYDRLNYMGGHYIFARTYGLAAIGSTKIGSMLDFGNFYKWLGSPRQMSLGRALKEWFSVQDLSSFYGMCWNYGMTILGDPTLKTSPDMNISP